MEVRLQKWGNSDGIRIPSAILKALNLKTDDKVNIENVDDKIVISKTKKHLTFEERVAKYKNNDDLVIPYDWGESMGKEIW